MPLQNRVDPFGEIHSTPARGLFTGNRGVIHDPDSRTLLKRRWTSRAWIVCECAFRGRSREVMGRNAPRGGAGWTELFFLDEVTALAAGHRPCFYCRRERAKRFSRCLAQALHRPGIRAPEIDALLHAQRWASAGSRETVEPEELHRLPDATVVASGGTAYALRAGLLLPWSFDGYGKPRPGALPAVISIVTPSATRAALAAGYQPVWHPTAPVEDRT
ncbi:hypothetical protein [Nitratireductor thuwali]|uniref:Uncharacterized protein n=1 Tax=Nitratireductor thuwali TaxID=2267699 RepID=A0ABY5MNT3_9HYPH|nr:hypothetical protein NTH_02962 [Nitratireductor thuwali]